MITESVSSAQASKIVRSELLELRSDDFPALKMELLSPHVILFAGSFTKFIFAELSLLPHPHRMEWIIR